MGNLTNISDRLTPSTPIEITFAAQPIATGRKFTTLFGHMAASGAVAAPYSVYNVVNVGDPAAALAEVNALAGAGSQIGAMAKAFVLANTGVTVARNIPAFRVVFLPSTELHFGPNQEAINAVKFLRSDMLVSCYPASDSTNLGTLQALCSLISGIDRDLQGQFGSFVMVGSIDPLATAEAYDINSNQCVVAFMPDSNTAAVAGVTGTTTSGSNVLSSVAQAAFTPTATLSSSSTTLTAVSSTAGIYPGASVTGTDIPSNTIVEAVTVNSLTISNFPTGNVSSETITVTNLPTAGIYPGAQVSGTGIPSGTVVESVGMSSLTLSNNASSSHSSESITVQNVISQPPEILASALAAVMMQSAFPYNPLQGMTVGGLVPPQISSDRIDVNPSGASEAALVAGLAPLYVQAGGTVGIIRTRTTYVLLPDNVTAVTAYFDWQDLVVLNDFREDCFAITQNPPFNNNPGGTKASQFIANLLKDEILREAQDYETQGAFQGVKTLAPQFIVQPSTTSQGRFDFQIPVNVVPGLFVIAGNIQAVSGIGNFTL
jgi:hypothetical protein